MPAEPYGAALIGPIPCRAGRRRGACGWRGRYGARCARTADRPDARPAAAVRDAERLVQVEVETSPPNSPGLRVAQQRVEVGAVDVHLPAVLVHDLAELGDAVLVDAVRRRVGHHDRGEVVGVLRRTSPRRSSRSTVPSSAALTTTTRMPAITADAALVPCAEDGIRQTSRCRVAVRPVVAADRQQPGELALRAGVGLDRDPVVAGDLGEPALELLDERDGSPRRPRPARTGAGRRSPASVTGSISVVALSFIVHEPSGIMPRSSA